MLEKTVKAHVRKRLKKLGAYQYWPVPMGLGAATVDVLVAYRGAFIGIEVKRPKGKVTLRQRMTLEEIKAAGGYAVTITCLEDIDIFLTRENLDNQAMAATAIMVTKNASTDSFSR